MMVIDRLEGEWAIIDDEGRFFHLPRRLLPREAREGDVVRVTVVVDPEQTEARRRHMQALVDKVFEP